MKEQRVTSPLTRPATVAFGLASFYLLDLTGPVVASDHDLIYHLTGSAAPIILPIILYVVALWGLLTVLLRVAERPGALRVIVWAALLFAAPLVLLHTLDNFFDLDIPDWVTALIRVACLSLFVLACVFWKRCLRWLDNLQPVAASILGFLALAGAIVFAQLLWNAWQARHLNAPRVLHVAQATQATRPRVIWLLFDELSYQQLYETRYPGLALPEFDRLAAQSTVFTHAVPAGEYTRYVIPALFTGTPTDAVTVSGGGLLLGLKDSSSDRWKRFDPHQTVFQDALDAGYSTAIDGWYNPYCRIMPQVLDHCFWTYRESTPANLSSHRSLGVDLLRPFRYLLLEVEHLFGRGPGVRTEESRDLRQHTSDYRSLVTAADRDLNDPSITFLFLHLPIPHPYGFYDRKTDTFSTHHTSYVDNLALSDLYLAHLRHLLEEHNQWDSTTLIVMGDHSWRTSFVWKDSSSWTPEDEAASHGGAFDDRPAYIVKLPGQQTPARIDQPFPAIETRALFDALLTNHIHDPSDLRAWVAGRR